MSGQKKGKKVKEAGCGCSEDNMEKELFMAALEAELREQAAGNESLRFFDYRKNNGITKKAISVKFEGSVPAPTFYPEEYFDNFLQGETVEHLASALLEKARSSRITGGMDLDFWKDYEKVKPGLSVKLIGYEKNCRLLEEIPYEKIEDMAAVFYYVLQDPQVHNATILIYNSHLKIWNITAETLCADAFRNAARTMPARILSLREILGMDIYNTAGPEENEQPDNKQNGRDGEAPEETMYVLSNSRSMFGAACMLYPDVLKNFADRKQSSLYILPSSIHEVILMPDDGNRTAPNCSRWFRRSTAPK
jgi:hypothetical protein